jgi:prepilin-type N-terminal cleavage/methylation domain-containing protein
VKNRSGFTLIEVMVGVALLGVISWGVFNGVKMWNTEFQDMQQTSTGYNIVAEILNSVAVRGQYLQVDYSDDPGVTILSTWDNDDELPMAWNKSGVVYPVAECSAGDFPGNCPRGRYGFIAKPITGFRGLYKITIMITHPEWQRPRILYALTGE